MAKIMPLNGLIHSKFETEKQMAEALGWPKQRLSKITCGIKEPDLDEVQSIANALNVSFMTVADIFLARTSPNGDDSEHKEGA